MKHRVLFLSNHPSPHMADLFRAIHRHRKMCLQVLFISSVDPGRSWNFDREGFPNRVLRGVHIHGRHTFNRDALRVVVDYVGKGYLPIICGYTAPTTLMSILLLTLARKPWLLLGETPGQDYRAGTVKRTLRSALVRRLLAGSSGVLAISRNGVRRYGHLCPSVRIAHFQYYEAAGKFRGLLRHRAGSDGMPRFLVCGALCHRKAPGLALEASKTLLDRGLAHRLIFAGDGGLLRELQRYCEQDRLAHVQFTGQVSWSERHEIFADADVLIHPARFDGWGMVVPEALSAGMPVVTTDACGAAVDFIENGKNGFLLHAPGGAEALCEKMAYFVTRPGEIARMGRLARDSVEGWTPQRGAQRLCETLDRWHLA